MTNKFFPNLKGALMNPLSTVHVAIVLGSYSDGDTEPFWYAMKKIAAEKCCDALCISGHVISCHRNSRELREFVENKCGGAQIVVGAGSEALALPGVIDTLLYESGQQIPVIGVALGEPGSDSLLAAQLSIERLPGQPVILDVTGRCYSGKEGLVAALMRIATEGIPSVIPRVEKPALLNFFRNF